MNRLKRWVALALLSAVGRLAASENAGMDADASRLFERISPSVVTVRTFDRAAGEIAQGSGVVVAPASVATNCHVLRGATRVEVANASGSHEARLVRRREGMDICLLVAPGLTAPSVPLRGADSVAVGEPVLAVGNPLGFGIAPSAGLIVLSRAGGIPGQFITSAPVSPGSSGGGLFDSNGQLIGLTTAILGVGQSFNLVLAADGLDRLNEPGEPVSSAHEAQPGPERRWIDEAKALERAGEWTALERLAREWVAARSHGVTAIVTLGRAVFEQGRKEEAGKLCDQAVQLDPNFFPAWILRAEVLHRSGRNGEAEAALTRVSEIFPAYGLPHFMRGEWLRLDRRFAEARPEIELSLRLMPDSPAAWTAMGQIEDALGRPRESERAFAIALALSRPASEPVPDKEGLLATEPRAIKPEIPTEEKNATMARTWYARGQAELGRGNLGPALDAFRQAASLSPQLAPAWNGIGTSLARLGRNADAEEAYTRAIAADPSDAEPYTNRASIRHVLGKGDAALADARHAVDLAPEFGNGWRVLGLIQFARGADRDAIAAFGRLDAMHQADAESLVTLGEALARQGKVADGLATLKRAEQANPKLVRMLLSTAMVLGRSGNLVGALSYLDRALELEPNNVQAWSSKGYGLVRQGKLAEGTDALETAVRLAPDFANAWINLGEAQLRRRQYGRAIEALEKATSLAPEAIDARIYLAEAYLDTRQPAKARIETGRILAREPRQESGLAITVLAYLMENNASAASDPYVKLRAANPTAARALRARALNSGIASAAKLPE